VTYSLLLLSLRCMWASRWLLVGPVVLAHGVGTLASRLLWWCSLASIGLLMLLVPFFLWRWL